ncbi:MAG: hypothetical protein H0U49_04005, partial [Parachlamydiaceae bacterium]|nr:hypothetical protein [Parachlamydiaceae bacterium]
MSLKLPLDLYPTKVEKKTYALKAEKREDDWISIVAYKSIDPFFNDAFCFEKSPNIKFGSVSD